MSGSDHRETAVQQSDTMGFGLLYAYSSVRTSAHTDMLGQYANIWLVCTRHYTVRAPFVKEAARDA